MSDPAYLTQAALWAACCIYAIAVGRGYARLAAALLLSQMLIELVAYWAGSGVGVKLTTGLTDAFILVALVRAVYVEKAVWATSAAGGQTMSVAVQVARSLGPQYHKWAAVTALELFGYWVLVSVVFGALKSRQR